MVSIDVKIVSYILILGLYRPESALLSSKQFCGSQSKQFSASSMVSFSDHLFLSVPPDVPSVMSQSIQMFTCSLMVITLLQHHVQRLFNGYIGICGQIHCSWGITPIPQDLYNITSFPQLFLHMQFQITLVLIFYSSPFARKKGITFIRSKPGYAESVHLVD